MIERPGRPLAFVEIKSTDMVDEADVAILQKEAVSYPKAELFCLSCDSHPKQFGRVQALHWQEGIKALGLEP